MATRIGLVRRCPIEAGLDEFVMARGDADMRSVGDQPQRQVQVLLRLYTNLLPALRAHALATQPSWVTGSSGGKRFCIMRHALYQSQPFVAVSVEHDNSI